MSSRGPLTNVSDVFYVLARIAVEIEARNSVTSIAYINTARRGLQPQISVSWGGVNKIRLRIYQMLYEVSINPLHIAIGDSRVVSNSGKCVVLGRS
jgi:hypothetical protein